MFICIWWYRCGVDDAFGIMVVSGCRAYVTEPVDVVLVVPGRVLYVVVGPLHVCTVLWWWFVLGASSMIVLMVVVEYTTRVVTLLWMCIIVCGVGCDDFQCDREIYFMCDGGKGGAKVDGGR